MNIFFWKSICEAAFPIKSLCKHTSTWILGFFFFYVRSQALCTEWAFIDSAMKVQPVKKCNNAEPCSHPFQNTEVLTVDHKAVIYNYGLCLGGILWHQFFHILEWICKRKRPLICEICTALTFDNQASTHSRGQNALIKRKKVNKQEKCYSLSLPTCSLQVRCEHHRLNAHSGNHL